MIDNELSIYDDEYIEQSIENFHILLSIEDYLTRIIDYIDNHRNYVTHHSIYLINLHNEYNRIVNELIEVTFGSNKKENNNE